MLYYKYIVISTYIIVICQCFYPANDVVADAGGRSDEVVGGELERDAHPWSFTPQVIMNMIKIMMMIMIRIDMKMIIKLLKQYQLKK